MTTGAIDGSLARAVGSAPDLRALVHRPYLVLYAIHPDGDDTAVNVVEIVRIVDGRRDLAACTDLGT